MLIALLLLLLAIHLIFRDGLIAGCLGMILAPVIVVLGFNLLIVVLQWIF